MLGCRHGDPSQALLQPSRFAAADPEPPRCPRAIYIALCIPAGGRRGGEIGIRCGQADKGKPRPGGRAKDDGSRRAG